MDVTSANIENALYRFYHESGGREELDTWLTSVQRSPEAWTFSWELLQAGKSPEIQFFGASCLHIKVTRHWHELPKDEVLALRDRLFESILQYATGPRIVLTRLCVTLAGLILQTLPDVWASAIEDVISVLQQQSLVQGNGDQAPRQSMQLVLFEVLRVLPEEFSTAFLDQHKKRVVRNALQNGFLQVLPLLTSAIVPSNPQDVFEQGLRCFSSWAQFGAPLMASEGLVSQVFEAVQKEEFFETAVDTLIQVFSHPETYQFPHTVQKFLVRILQLQGVLEKALFDRDMDTCQGLTKLVVTAADQNTQLLLNLTLGSATDTQLALGVVNMILKCTAVPGYFPVDECCSDLPFGFWYNLQDEIVGSERDKYLALLPLYGPMYLSLIEVLLRKVRYPEDNEYQAWNAEEKEAHRCYRQDIADTFMYAHNLLHDSMLNSLCRLLEALIQSHTAGQKVEWQQVEAVLYALTSVAENIDTDECVCLPSLFLMLGKVPCTDHKLVSQALFLIGSYAEWISIHPEVLGSVIPLLLQGVRDRELAQPASLSMKEVLRENQDHIPPFAPAILCTCREAMESGVLKSRDCLRLMSCLGYVLSTLPLEQIMDYLNVLLMPHIDSLKLLAAAEVSVGVKVEIQLRINMLAWLFGSLNTKYKSENDGEDKENPSVESNMAANDRPQPILLILRQVLPILQIILQKWAPEGSIIEDVCDMLKRGVRTLLGDITPLVTDISHLIAQIYTVHPHPAVLDVTKQILILFATEDQYKNVIQVLFNTICEKTLTLIASDAHQHPEVTEGFMSLVDQTLKKNKSLLRDESCDIGRLMDAGILALGLREAPTIRAAGVLLCNLLACTEMLPSLPDITRSRGLSLVDRLMRSIGGETPRATVEPMADVFFALNKHHYALLCQLMNSFVSQEAYPSASATKESRELFARRILTEKTNKRRTREIVQEFSLIWRGLIHTEYGRQTTPQHF